MVRSFLLMIFAAVCVAVLFAPLIIIQSMRFVVMRKPLKDLWFTIAIGLDQLGGSIIYAEPDWTVSSCTGFYAMKGNKYALVFERFIDLLFGKGHCRASYKRELVFNKEDLR